jgi:hypothetical protein
MHCQQGEKFELEMAWWMHLEGFAILTCFVHV